MKCASALVRFGGTCFCLVSQGCASPASQTGTTGDFALTGTASVLGTVLDTVSVPLDSFQVAVNVPDGGALYRTQQVVTTSDGKFAIVIERRGAIPSGDSVVGAVNATSLRARDRKPDGGQIVVSVPVWLRFVLPPAVPVPREVAVRAPVAK